jgi:hypothetical protein
MQTLSAQELQHINVKLFLQNSKDVDLEPLIPIFQGWIQDQADGDLLLDIADYRHVEAGPGVVLIGHEGNYSVDYTDGRLGVRYNRKAGLSGTNQDRLAQATRAALTACQRLEEEPRLGGRLRFSGDEVEVFVNDRLIAPNRDSTREAFDADLQVFFKKLFGGRQYSTSYHRDTRRLFSVSVKTSHPFTIAELLGNLV